MAREEVPSARRQRSRQQLLNVIRAEAGVSRADLIRITGLSRSTIADGVQDLLSDRLIAEDQQTPGGKGAGRGRPTTLLIPTAATATVAGIDLGHDHLSVAIATTDGDVLAEQGAQVDVDTEAQASMDIAAGILSRLLDDLGLTIADVKCVGAGIPAPLDWHTKQISSTSIMSGWSGFNPEAELTALLGCRVVTANDADMGAYGEHRFGAARGLRDFLYVKVSEGVGASLFLNGAAYHGSAGLAGEIGHTPLSEQGAWCRCGNRGCLETVISTDVIHQRMREAGLQPEAGAFPLARVLRDPVTARAVTEAGRTLGRVLADVCNWLNPAGIILGGELGTAGRPLVDGARESINRYAQPAMAEAVEIKTGQLGLRSELVGAVATASQAALYLPA